MESENSVLAAYNEQLRNDIYKRVLDGAHVSIFETKWMLEFLPNDQMLIGLRRKQKQDSYWKQINDINTKLLTTDLSKKKVDRMVCVRNHLFDLIE
jgi:hypothetical protein